MTKYIFNSDGIRIKALRTDSSFQVILDVGEYQKMMLPFYEQGDQNIKVTLEFYETDSPKEVFEVKPIQTTIEESIVETEKDKEDIDSLPAIPGSKVTPTKIEFWRLRNEYLQKEGITKAEFKRILVADGILDNEEQKTSELSDEDLEDIIYKYFL